MIVGLKSVIRVVIYKKNNQRDKKTKVINKSVIKEMTHEEYENTSFEKKKTKKQMRRC